MKTWLDQFRRRKWSQQPMCREVFPLASICGMSKPRLFVVFQRLIDLKCCITSLIHFECAPILLIAITLGKTVHKQIERSKCSTADLRNKATGHGKRICVLWWKRLKWGGVSIKRWHTDNRFKELCDLHVFRSFSIEINCLLAYLRPTVERKFVHGGDPSFLKL